MLRRPAGYACQDWLGCQPDAYVLLLHRRAWNSFVALEERPKNWLARKQPWQKLTWVVAMLIVGYSLFPAQEATTPPARQLSEGEQKASQERCDQLLAKAQESQKAGKLDEAARLAEQLPQLERKLFGAVHANVLAALGFVAQLHEACEDFAAARIHRRKALVVARQLYGNEHWCVVDARLAVQHAELLAGLSAEQRQKLREATELSDQLAQLCQQGKLAAALAAAQRALQIYGEILGTDNPYYAGSLSGLAQLYEGQLKHLQSELLYRRAMEIYKHALSEPIGGGQPGTKQRQLGDGARRTLVAIMAWATSRDTFCGGLASGWRRYNPPSLFFPLSPLHYDQTAVRCWAGTFTVRRG